ncbi:hypothetical protein [Gilvimarinus sp. DA14]|uniref:hypothetical protein n=1 Tax=Gilvimarinus sp. DA14 TaxID=2956798 RepID=UPI0020B7D575|nr:hypothetical protein [Gilvimarinus sp. DA14]UTF59280.1 hypothetical protein NHM04_12430 [Gilvimarinus sp. DA14]
MALTLSACGGGEEGPFGESSSSVASSSSSGSSSESTEFDEVMGLYDASSGVDKNYYYIDSSGTLTAYNYLGDGADAGDNCYREAVEDDANADITGSSLNAESSGDYSIDIGGNTVTLEMTGDEITRISAGGISTVGSMALTLGGVSFRLTSKRATDLSIDDITSMMCE